MPVSEASHTSKIEQGVFFPTRSNRNEEIEIPKNGPKKATETGKVSHIDGIPC